MKVVIATVVLITIFIGVSYAMIESSECTVQGNTEVLDWEPWSAETVKQKVKQGAFQYIGLKLDWLGV